MPDDGRAQEVEADQVIAQVGAKVGDNGFCDLDGRKLDRTLPEHVAGKRRSRDAAALPSPLVFGFDGAGGSGLGMSATLLHQAWPEATVVYPDERTIQNPTGGSLLGWQLAPGDLGDRDVRFVDALLDDVSARYRVDPSRVYAAGFSYGAVFTYVLMRSRPDRFAAFAGEPV